MRLRSDKPTRNGGWLHTFGDAYVAHVKPITRKPVAATSEIAGIERRDAIFATLLRGHLVLSEKRDDSHRTALVKRGLSDERSTASAIAAHRRRNTAALLRSLYHNTIFEAYRASTGAAASG
jgi:hypothetical protein